VQKKPTRLKKGKAIGRFKTASTSRKRPALIPENPKNGQQMLFLAITAVVQYLLGIVMRVPGNESQ